MSRKRHKPEEIVTKLRRAKSMYNVRVNAFRRCISEVL